MNKHLTLLFIGFTFWSCTNDGITVDKEWSKDGDIENRTKKKGDTISDQQILLLLQNMVKQRKESVNIYGKAGRNDLKKREEKEIEIINSFLPKQITSEALEKIIIESMSELDCSSIKDLGNLSPFLCNCKDSFLAPSAAEAMNA